MRFSIVTITKNDPIGLAKTKASIKNQLFKDYEWIVIDGNKEDDHGIYDAMNKGIDRSLGDYIIFMNGGDTFANDTILARLSKFDADFIYGDSIEAEFIKSAKSIKKINQGMITSHQAMCYKRQCIGDLRFDLKYKIAADYKFTLEFLQKIHSNAYFPHAVCIFETGGFSQKNMKHARREEQQIRRELGIISYFTPYRQLIAAGVRMLSPRLYFMIRR